MWGKGGREGKIKRTVPKKKKRRGKNTSQEKIMKERINVAIIW